MEPPNTNIIVTVNNDTLFIPAHLVSKINKPDEFAKIKQACVNSLTRDGHQVFIYRDFIDKLYRKIDLRDTDLKVVKAFLEIKENRKEIDEENIQAYHKLNFRLCDDVKFEQKLTKAFNTSVIKKFLNDKNWDALQECVSKFSDECKQPFLAKLNALSKCENSSEEFSKLISILPILREDIAGMDLLNNPNVSDLTIKIGVKEFSVNAEYVRSQSPVIDDMLKFGLAETRVVELREDVGTENALHVLYGKSLEKEPNPALKFYTQKALELLGVKDIAPAAEELPVIHALEMRDEKLLSAITNEAMVPIIIGFMALAKDRTLLKMGLDLLIKNFPNSDHPLSLLDIPEFADFEVNGVGVNRDILEYRKISEDLVKLLPAILVQNLYASKFSIVDILYYLYVAHNDNSRKINLYPAPNLGLIYKLCQPFSLESYNRFFTLLRGYTFQFKFLEELKTNPLATDISINANGKEFRTNKMFLEKFTNIVKNYNLPLVPFLENFLEALHTGLLPADPKAIFQIFKLAKLYNSPLITELCAEKLSSSLALLSLDELKYFAENGHLDLIQKELVRRFWLMKEGFFMKDPLIAFIENNQHLFNNLIINFEQFEDESNNYDKLKRLLELCPHANYPYWL